MNSEYEDPRHDPDANPFDRDYDRNRDSDREPPRSSSNRSVWLILLAGGCGMFLLCGGGIVAFVIWGVSSFTKDFPAAQAVADQFLERLREGKIDDAYALTSPEFRAQMSQEQFGEFMKKHETFTRQTSRTQNGFRVIHDGGGKRVFIQMTLRSPNNAMTCTLVLIEEGGSWKVQKLTVP